MPYLRLSLSRPCPWRSGEPNPSLLNRRIAMLTTLRAEQAGLLEGVRSRRPPCAPWVSGPRRPGVGPRGRHWVCRALPASDQAVRTRRGWAHGTAMDPLPPSTRDPPAAAGLALCGRALAAAVADVSRIRVTCTEPHHDAKSRAESHGLRGRRGRACRAPLATVGAVTAPPARTHPSQPRRGS